MDGIYSPVYTEQHVIHFIIKIILNYNTSLRVIQNVIITKQDRTEHQILYTSIIVTRHIGSLKHIFSVHK